VVIKGPVFSDYMGVAGISADHMTLVLANSAPRLEVQLLYYLEPEGANNPRLSDLFRIGFNHIHFACDDLDGLLARNEDAGFRRHNKVLDFHSRRLVFLEGPEGVTVELVEWY
jgi:catechol 2,3-dioxygenase-like lactoylglutathione lyase family enzyme